MVMIQVLTAAMALGYDGSVMKLTVECEDNSRGSFFLVSAKGWFH